MKTFLWLNIILAASVLGASAQTLAATNSSSSVPDYQIVQQDANTRIWQRQIKEMGPSGEVVPHLQSYTEIASGLNYFDTNSDQWQPSSEEIDIQADGTAAAVHGQHQVYFPVDILNGNIEMVTPDGIQVKSQPAALAYDDGSNSVLIAVLTNSVGQVLGDNQVIYTNAFSGLNADLLYTYRKSGLEQDVILHDQPPTPDSLGLIPNSTRLEMLTEFLGSPSPVECAQATVEENGVGMTDSTLDFGRMQMVPGKAFKLGETTPSVRVCKSWVTLEGRHFLVEEVPVAGLTNELDTLPTASVQAVSLAKAHLFAGGLELPPQHWAKNKDHSLKLARANLKWKPGVVLDYNTINTSLTNYTFQGDTTYYVSGNISLYGTSTFEGGAIIKFAANTQIYDPGFGSQINWEASSYRPIVFTAKDDNSVGVPVTGSTGTPSGYYAQIALNLYEVTNTISHFRVCYAQQGIQAAYSSGNSFYDGQFINCQNGFECYSDTVKLRNVLFANVQTNLNVVNNGSVDVQNATFSGGSYLCPDLFYSSLSLENCVLANVTKLTNTVTSSTFNGTNNGFFNCNKFGSNSITNTFSPFQVSGGGSYYLTNGCNFHNAGTANVDSTLLADLGERTTYAPMIYSGVAFHTNLILGPIAARDTFAAPDLGYHYDPLDYIFGGSDVYSNLTFTAGTAVGWFYNYGGVSASGQPYAISLNSGANLTFSGNATALCWMAHSTTVQEGCNGSWTDTGWMSPVVLDGNGSGVTPQLNSYFAKWSVLGGDIGHFQDNWAYGEANIADSEFYIANITTYKMSLVNFTNCLFYRSALFLYDQDAAPTLNLINDTFYNGIMAASRTSGQNAVWTIQNTTFDGTGFRFTDYYGSNTTYTFFNYNAYNTNNLAGFTIPFPYGATTNYLEMIGTKDVKTGGFNWQNSWFGNFYLPTNSSLINAGNTNANRLGLYHFTTQASQAIESNSIVDIGYHYIATDAFGNPLDANGDGIPDYIEDANGNGVIDDGETNWALAILEQPESQTSNQWDNVTFTVLAGGIQPINYQWYFNNSPIGGATNSELLINSAQYGDEGSYFVVATNQFGAVTSSIASLTLYLTSITFSNFCDVSPLAINGNAHQTNTSDGCVLELTQASADQTGDAYLKLPLPLSTNSSFSTYFSFRLSKGGGATNVNGMPGADGISFIIQTLTNNVGGQGGGLGYQGITNSIAIEFDTWYNDNPELGIVDPNLPAGQTNANGSRNDGNHIGLDVNGNLNSIAYQHISIPMNNSNVWYAWIDYNGASSNLQVRVSETNSRPVTANLTTNISIISYLGKTNAYIGFGGGTGTAYQQQDILSWQVNPEYNPIGAFTVQITSPSNQTFLAWTNYVPVTALVSNIISGEPVNWVEFFDGGESIGYATSTNSTFQFKWIPAFSGTNILTAMAFNTNGNSVWSAPVTNYIRGLPRVQILSPVNNQIYSIPNTNILLNAVATAYGATISKVIYFQGTNAIGTNSTGSPYNITWSNVTNGTYTLHAEAVDSLGGISISSNIVVTVEPTNRPPYAYPGTNQTIYLSTNAFQLNGIVSDDGLPFGSTLTATWTNLNGGANVTFVNSNLPDTSAFFWATGTYTLQLSVSDSQYTTRSNVVITVDPANHPPAVWAGTNQTIVLPAASTNLFSTVQMTLISGAMPSPIGVDYYAKSNCVVASVNYSSNGSPYNLALVAANGTNTQFSSLSNLTDEVYISAVRNSMGGFKDGEMFTGNGSPGQIMRIEPDGTTIGTNEWFSQFYSIPDNNWLTITNTNSWLVLSNSIVGQEPGLLRGGLWVDRTGVWGGDLIVSTTVGDVWRVNSSGQATLVAQLSGGTSYEGLTTIPNDSVKYGPWAGCILVGDDGYYNIFAINTNGFSVRYAFPFGAEDIRVIPQSENFYGCNVSGTMYGIAANQFVGMTGDIIVADPGEAEGDVPGEKNSIGGHIYRLHWDGQKFETSWIDPIGAPDTWEGINFAPAGLLNLPPSTIQLQGSVTDDGEAFASPSNTWSVASGPGTVTIIDPNLTNSAVEFSVSGTYILKLSAYDGQYTTSSNVTIQVVQNQPPTISAGTNQFLTNTISTVLKGSVSDDGYPYHQTNIVWSLISAPPTSGFLGFSSSKVINPTVSFNTNDAGTYVFLLSADDGQATNSAEVSVTVCTPTLIIMPALGEGSPTNLPYTVKAQLLAANGKPISGATVNFSVSWGNSTNGSGITDANGYTSFTYSDLASSLGQDKIDASYGGISATTAYNYWTPGIFCGEQVLGYVGSYGPHSVEWTNLPADYYTIDGTVSNTVELTLNQASGPLLMYLKDPSGQVVASTSLNYPAAGTINSLTATFATNGDYTVEVFGPFQNISYYLSAYCSSGTNDAPNMQVLYNGTNVPNGNWVTFPLVNYGTTTNITLTITNSGNFPFEITGFGTNGGFVVTNNILGVTVVPGGKTNAVISYQATQAGQNLGALVLDADYPGGTNFITYFLANTAPTSSPPSIQIISPINGATVMKDKIMNVTVLVTPGSAPYNPQAIGWESISTNGVTSTWNIHKIGYPPPFNSISGNLCTNSGTYWGDSGDYTYAATIQDDNGQTAISPPVLVHVVPFLPTSPTNVCLMEVLLNGTNVSAGSTVVLPTTAPGQPTNLWLTITNMGNYPLEFPNVDVFGDFQLPTNLVGEVLMPGQFTNFSLIFNASTEGQNFGQLILSNNATPGNLYMMNLVGNAFSGGAVMPSNSNLPPIAVNDQFTVLADSVHNILYPLANDIDSNGYPMKIVSITQPGNGGTATIVNNGTAISYTPPAGIRSYPNTPADGFYYTISDASGLSNSASISIIISASDQPQVSWVNPPNNYTADAGDAVPLIASVSPTQNIAQVLFYEGQTLIGSVTNRTSGNYTNMWAALYNPLNDEQFTVQAIDTFGQVNTSTPISINVTAPPGSGQAVAALNYFVDTTGTNYLNATNLITIRDGLLQLFGQAYHTAGSNVVWQLGVYTIDGTLVRDLTPTTTGTVGTSSVSGNFLNCDLTTLMNGVYVLQLTVTGGYATASSSIQFRLESNLKIGEFSFSQQDLVIPANGIPLTVTRTYNSINPNKGDFGYGWTYALNNMAVSLDESRENTTDLDGDTYSERVGGSWDVTLTLPNGQTTTFAFYLAGPDTLGTYDAEWQAAPGVTATLQAQGNSQLETLVGSLTGDSDLIYWDANPQTPMNNFDFQGFILTTADGTQYYINREDLGDHEMLDGGEGDDVQAYGQPYLSKIVERDGDIVYINPDSVVFQATNGASRQITFQRNADGLITSVTDPNSQTNGGPPAVEYQYDNNDNLIAVLNLVNSAGSGTYVTNSFSYTNAYFPHYITGIVNADGNQVAKNFYDSSGKLTAVQDAYGNLTQYIHNLTNSSEVIIDRLGNTNTYVYDLNGNIIVQTNQLGQISTMAYDANNNKTREVAYLGSMPYATNTYAYNTNLNVMTNSIDPLGHTNSSTYDANGDLTSSMDAKGNITTNIYDGNGNLVQTADALNDITYNTYRDGLLVNSQDPVGTMTYNAYDNYENLTSSEQVNASGIILSSNTYAYDANGNRTNSTTWRHVNGTWTAAVTTYIYDAMNRVIQTINPDGGTNTVVYDPTGKQLETIDALGNTNSYVYDAEGRLIQTIYPDGTTTKSSYDANGNRIASVDQLGRTTYYVYDALSRLVQTVYPDNTTNTTIYDAVGRVAQTVDARGTITAYGYDAADRRLAVTNALGVTGIQNVSTYTYDANGNQLTFTDPNSHITTNVYDALNRQVQMQYPDGTKSSTGYDADGRSVVKTNQDGLITHYGYDGSGRLTSVTNALSQVTKYQYDEAGNEVLQIDALGRTNAYAYDGQGRRVLHQRPDGLMEGFTYDWDGNVVEHTNFDSTVIYNSYDSLNQLTNVNWQNSMTYAFTYTPTGQKQSETGNSGVLIETYNYDSRDRLVQKEYSQPGFFGTGFSCLLTYGYDVSGNVTNIASGYANGVNLVYAYDALNRLTNVSNRGQAAANYRYDGAGNLVGMGYGNGVTNQYGYDSLNRLTNLVWKYQSTTRGSFAYQLMAAGSRTNLTESVNGQAAVTYAWSYDHLYRMTNEIISGMGTAAYQYDVVGNRTNRVTSGSTMIAKLPSDTYGYDTNDELLADGNVGSGNNQYDSNGNMKELAKTGNTYEYDGWNRVVSGPTYFSAMYDYEGDRLLESWTTNGGQTVLEKLYLVDDRNPSGYAQVLEEYQGVEQSGGNQYPVLSRTYAYGLGLISQQQYDTNTLLPTTLSYYGYDGHGSVRFLMNTNGTVTDTYVYDAYGSLLAQSNNTPNEYLYCGQQYDPVMGAYYNRARYLNVDYGRFWSADSYEGDQEDPLSLHKYLYAEADPIDGADPLGFSDATAFGNRVQEVITDDFIKTGNGNGMLRDGNRATGTMVGELSIGSLRKRPDLYQENEQDALDSKNNFFFEIKPSTEIKQGLNRVELYNRILNHYGAWRPGGAYDYFYSQNGAGPFIITKDRAGRPLPGGYIALVLPPSSGLMIYIKLSGNIPENFLELMIISVKQYSEVAGEGAIASEEMQIEREAAAVTEMGEVGAETAQVATAGIAGVEADTGVAAMDTELGAP